MRECSICGRNTAARPAPYRQCEGRWVCGSCWDSLACTLLAHAALAELDPERASEPQRSWIRHIMAEVAQASLR